MTQKAAAKTTTTDKSVQKAKKLFFVGLFDLSWKLAICIIVPVVAGAWLDGRYDTGSKFTLVGMFIGFGLSAWMIKMVVARISKEEL